MMLPRIMLVCTFEDQIKSFHGSKRVNVLNIMLRIEESSMYGTYYGGEDEKLPTPRLCLVYTLVYN